METTTPMTETTSSRGFTLIEVLLAISIAAMAMIAVSGSFISTLRARKQIESLSTSTEAGQRILTLIERDLQGLWHHNVQNNKVLVGRDLDIAGYDADRLDMLTTTDAISGTMDAGGKISHPSVCEVGYWLKQNPQNPRLLELWRREDPMVDDDILTDGHFQLVSDRLESFNITYYETLGTRAEELREWDSSREDKLPRRLKIEFKIHRKVANRNEVADTEVDDFESIVKTYVRHVVLDRRYTEILKPGIAMLPIAPPPPDESGGGPIGGGGGQTGGGPAGAGPAGAKGPDGGEGGARGGAQRGGAQRGGGEPPQQGGTFNLGDLLRGAGSGRGGGGGGGGLFGR